MEVSSISVEVESDDYGWFSKKQMALRRNRNKTMPKYNIYITEDGNEVPVTMVTKTKRREDLNFDDIVFQGRVVKWARAVF